MNSNFPPAVPEIPVSNIEQALAYYQNALGFQKDWYEEGHGIAGISKGQCRMFLTSTEFREDKGNAPPVLIWLNLNNKAEVDALHEEWQSTQATIVSPPEDKPWHLREFTVADPDGNLYRVFYDFSRDVEA